MAKTQLVGWIHEPLTAIVGTRSKVAVLRVLWRATAPIPYREVVRRTGLAYGSVDLAIGDLLMTGLVAEVPEGRERRIELATTHRLAAAVSALLQVESDFYSGLRVELRAMAQDCLGAGMLSIAIVGRVTRREERLHDGLEVVAIAADDAALARCSARMRSTCEAVRTRFGVRVKVIGYSRAAALAMWQSRTAAAAQSVQQAELLAGVPLDQLLNVGDGAE